jgi:cyanophycinase-like exopeptidase
MTSISQRIGAALLLAILPGVPLDRRCNVEGHDDGQRGSAGAASNMDPVGLNFPRLVGFGLHDHATGNPNTIATSLYLTPGECRPVVLFGGGETLPLEVFNTAKVWAESVQKIKDRTPTKEMGNAVAVLTWASKDAKGARERVLNMFDQAIPAPETLTFEQIAQRVENGDREGVVKEIKATLSKCSILYFSGGDQARIAYIFKLLPEVREFIIELHESGYLLPMGTSAGTAILCKKPIFGGSGRGADGSGLTESDYQELVDPGVKHCDAAIDGLGLDLFGRLTFDQHHGIHGSVVRRLEYGEKINVFPEGALDPRFELRPGREARLAPFARADDGATALGVWEDCGVLVVRPICDTRTMVQVFENPSSLIRVAGFPACLHASNGLRQYLYPGLCYDITDPENITVADR